MPRKILAITDSVARLRYMAPCDLEPCADSCNWYTVPGAWHLVVRFLVHGTLWWHLLKMPPKRKDGTQPPQLETGCLRIGKDSSRITVSGNSFCDSYIGDGAVQRKVNDQLAGGIVLEGT